MATIGFAGLGQMGTPMVGRLAAAGHRLLVFDIAPAARARHQGIDGIAVVSQVAEIADGADVVILMLPDSAVVTQVLLADGLLEHVASSAVVVDMSSSVPARTRELARAAAERGVTLIDAPVSGGVAGAQSGSLTIMAGGPADVLDRLRPVLQVLGSRVVHAGDLVGAGHAIKALNNMMSAAHLLASSEALLAGRRFGLDPDVMLSIVNSSSGRSGSTQVKWPKFILPDTYDSGFGLRLMLKDMRIALQLEQEAGVPAPIAQAAVAAWAAAAEDLPPAADHTEIARWLAGGIDQSGKPERPLPIASSRSTTLLADNGTGCNAAYEHMALTNSDQPVTRNVVRAVTPWALDNRVESALAGRAWAWPASGWRGGSELQIPIGNRAGAGRWIPASETRRGVPQAGQPGLGVVALGDDSGDAPADAGQWTRYALRHVVIHRSSSVSGYLFAGHY